MQRSLLILLLSVLAILASCVSSLQAARKPNVLLIFSDDHGWTDLGIQGVDADCRTPNFDQLARDGVFFQRGYVTAPQCVPSRAGLLTGRYQQRFGVEDNNKGPLPLSEITIAERLSAAGYVTGMSGKWHLDLGSKGGNAGPGRLLRALPEHMPHGQGFQEYWRGELRQYYASHSLQGEPFPDAPRMVSDDRFRVVVQTEAALSFLERRAQQPDQPWFLYLAWYAPHVPLESPEPWFSQTSAELPRPRRQALAMLAAMDDGLGRIRAKLHEMGADRDTLIFFIGDNGAPLGSAWNGSSNRPLVGQKGMVADGGIRTPFLAAWPGTLPAGLRYDQPVISLDVAATAVAVAGLPSDPRLDGVNLLPYLTGQDAHSPHETLFWRWGSQAAVLEMPYKLIRLGDRPPLLFDVTQPDGEDLDRDLAARQPEVVAKLDRQLEAWAASLQPAGLDRKATAFSRRHEELFSEHHMIRSNPANAAPAGPAGGKPDASGKGEADGSVQGWIARNGVLVAQDGALVLTPAPSAAANARPFLTQSGLDLQGPVQVKLKLRGNMGGPSTVTWRTKEKSFAPEQTATFDWPKSNEWQEVQLRLPEAKRILHIRITPPKSVERSEVQAIELRDEHGKTQAWRF